MLPESYGNAALAGHLVSCLLIANRPGSGCRPSTITAVTSDCFPSGKTPSEATEPLKVQKRCTVVCRAKIPPAGVNCKGIFRGKTKRRKRPTSASSVTGQSPPIPPFGGLCENLRFLTQKIEQVVTPELFFPGLIDRREACMSSIPPHDKGYRHNRCHQSGDRQGFHSQIPG